MLGILRRARAHETYHRHRWLLARAADAGVRARGSSRDDRSPTPSQRPSSSPPPAVALLRTVLSRPFDHLVGNRTTERGASHGIAAIVNAGPDARLVGFLGERGKRSGITREQVPEDCGRRGRKAAVRGRIAWMVRC